MFGLIVIILNLSGNLSAKKSLDFSVKFIVKPVFKETSRSQRKYPYIINMYVFLYQRFLYNNNLRKFGHHSEKLAPDQMVSSHRSVP